MTKAQRKAARAAQRRQKKKQGQKYPVAVVMPCRYCSKRALSPQIIPTQSTSTHCSQAYGADVMRMWSATADYSKDVTVSRHTTFSHAIAC